jgi:DNA-binding GntR family transcriptional regulator
VCGPEEKLQFKSVAHAASSATPEALGTSFGKSNREFHFMVAHLCGNRYLIGSHGKTMASLFGSQFRPHFDRSAEIHSAPEHGAIAQTIEAGDSSSAYTLMQAHVRNAERVIMSLGDELFRPTNRN